MQAADILARGPRYMGGALLNYGTHWTHTDRQIVRILAEANTSLPNIAEAIGRPENAIRECARRLRMKSPAAWRRERKAATPRIKRPVWTPLAYPYINVRRAENHTLLLVNQMVSQAIPGREDICQEVMLAILEQGLTPDKATVASFVRKFKRENYEGNGYALSLDAPFGDTDLTIADTLSGESSFDYWNRL